MPLIFCRSRVTWRTSSTAKSSSSALRMRISSSGLPARLVARKRIKPGLRQVEPLTKQLRSHRPSRTRSLVPPSSAPRGRLVSESEGRCAIASRDATEAARMNVNQLPRYRKLRKFLPVVSRMDHEGMISSRTEASGCARWCLVLAAAPSVSGSSGEAGAQAGTSSIRRLIYCGHPTAA